MNTLLWILLAVTTAGVLSQDYGNDHRKPSNYKGRLPKYYSDAYARHLYWPVCSFAYGNTSTVESCQSTCFYNSELLTFQSVHCGIGEGNLELDPCVGSVSVAHDYKAVVLVFRGSDTVHQLGYIINTSSLWEPTENAEIPIGKMNFYYTNGFNLLFINNTLQTVFDQAINRYPNYDILIAGHSLGGAFSTLAAAYIRLNYPNVPAERLIVATFGQIVVGDAEFATNFQELVPYNYRVVHASDFVPRMASEMTFNGTDELAYLQVHGDIWYDNAMDDLAPYNVCPGLYHEGYCTYYYNSTTAPRNTENALDHVTYFDQQSYCLLCNRTLNLAFLPS